MLSAFGFSSCLCVLTLVRKSAYGHSKPWFLFISFDALLTFLIKGSTCEVPIARFIIQTIFVIPSFLHLQYNSYVLYQDRKLGILCFDNT